MPGFFLMNINVDLHNNISWNEFNDEQKSTFIHEYIHYLQDITTTNGFHNFNFFAQINQLYLNKIATYTNQEIKVPIDLEMCNVENAFEESEIVKLYEGDNHQKKIHHVNNVFRELEECYKEEFPNSQDMYNINIYYNNTGIAYRFGTRCICESMAYLIESWIYKEKRNNELPYNSCEMVCKSLYPEISTNIPCMIALCDISLMHYHSGDFFYNLILCMKKDNFIPKDAKDVYDYTNPRIPHLYDNLLEQYKMAKQNIDIIYPNKINITDSVRKWLVNIFLKGLEFRMGKNNFVCKLTELNKKEDVEKYFLKLTNYFSLPVITDINKDVFGTYESQYIILVPIALIDLFTKRKGNECILYEYCKKQGQVLLSDNMCKITPWKQADREELCPLALYWYHYSLTGKILKRI